MVRRAGFRIQDSGFRVRETGFGIRDSGFRKSRRAGKRALRYLLVLALSLVTRQASLLFAQQPQAQQGQPLSALNAKYVNGVAPGYWPTQGTGLTLNLSAGSSICANAPASYAGGTLTMTASATNYVFLDMSNNCTPAFTSGGSGFPVRGVPIAVVTTSSSAITAISDARTWFAARPVIDPGGQVYNVKAYGATGNGSTDDTAAILATISAAGAGGVILFPPGAYLISSQVQVTANNQMVYGYGATLKCNQTTATDCFMIGSTSNPTLTDGITIYGLHLAPGPNSAANSAFRDNAQNTHFIDIGGTGQYTCSGWCSFYHFLENDDDQAEVVDHLYDLNPNATILGCTASACGSALWAPGPFSTNAGITWLKNSNLSVGCTGNGIDWQSGNHLTVSDSIFQGYSQFAWRIGGNSSAEFDGWNHTERGGCVNPLNDGNGHALGGAGLLMVGAGNVEVHGSAPFGGTTNFQTNSAGSTTYEYYIVAHKASPWVTAPLPIGYLTNGPATIGSSANVFTLWPALPTAVSYDLLRETNGGQAPYGTGAYAVATGLLPANVCNSNGVCSFTDNVTTPTSYTTPIGNSSMAVYAPSAPFWPGDLVLMNQTSEAGYVGVGNYQGPSAAGFTVVNTGGTDMANVHIAYNAGTDGKFAGDVLPVMPGLAYAPGAFDTAGGNIWPLLLPKYASSGGWNYEYAKGIINIGSLIQAGPSDLFTFHDSNYPKTLATNGFRPSWDVGDTAFSEDDTTGSAFAVRAAKSLSTYINSFPDGMSWATRTYSTGQASSIPYYGVKSVGVGTPVAVSVSDVTSASVWQASYTYHGYNTYPVSRTIIYDGANWEEMLWPGTTGATAPTWATTAGQQTQDGTVTWVCLGSSSLSANTTYYIKVASATPSGYSAPTGEMSVTTANDSNKHLILVTEGINNPTKGATGYQAGCSTTSGTETPVSPPYAGAYNTGSYAYFPIMNCSGSGSFNSNDTTGYASFPGMFVGGGTAINAMNLYSTSSITPTAVSSASCSDQTFTVTGLLATDRISNITPPSALGNVSLNGYASAAGAVLLHFCNPSSSSVTPPAGVYSFLAVH